ncbi:hypothetical protein FOL46_005647 [Perkinsus olseni]|uniref:Peptidase S9 prolyl oligopeptidase catalytic domain-containing protein n=1 Tax=Perkinsus olseni TaxID=32597 RepID=A0A7J6LRL8_PEROL|nr:hypothetical protein FOL46_005647 [Perkinsus olseni]
MSAAVVTAARLLRERFTAASSRRVAGGVLGLSTAVLTVRATRGQSTTSNSQVAFCESARQSVKTGGFKRPGPPLEELVLTPPDPVFSLAPVNPSGSRFFIEYGRRTSFTTLADVCIEANTKHRLGGLDFDAATRMPTSLTWYDWIGPEIKCLDDDDDTTNAPTIISGLPSGEGIKYAFVKWSARGDRLAITVRDDASSTTSLYIIDALKGQASRVAEGLRLNAVTGACPYLWSSDGDQLLLWCVPEANMRDIDSKIDRLLYNLVCQESLEAGGRFTPPEGPVTEECQGKKQETRTYANTLKSPYDDKLFEYYTQTQMYIHTVASGQTRKLGSPSMICDTSFSPDNCFLLVTEITGPPFSRSLLMSRFGRQFSVLSLASEGDEGPQYFPLHRRPAQEDRPNRFDACPPGPRGFRWLPVKPHSLVFVVADGDNGDPRSKGVSHRDTAMVVQEAPWDLQQASVLFRSEMRMHNRMRFTSDGDIVWTEWRFKDKSHRVWMRPHGIQPSVEAATGVDDFALPRNETTEVKLNPANGCLLLHSGKYDDAYTSMGDFQTVRGGPFNRVVLQQVNDGSLVLFGDGASDVGLRPFVDSVRIQLSGDRTAASVCHRRLWRCCLGEDVEEDAVDTQSEVESQPIPPRGDYLEQPIRLLGDGGQRLLLARESIAQPRERFLRDMVNGREKPVTVNKDPRAKQAPLFDNLVEKKVLHYKREDGVDLTATLYLPKKAATEGRPPPCIVWAYPESYSSGKSAGQVRVSKYQFKRATWGRPLMWISKGWAVLDKPSMPIIGDGDTANDTFIEQLVMNGEAAVAAATANGVDPSRIAVGGHSYGGFMTANLIAHSRPGLFRAGIGRSGGYNRSLTPFGFQREERNYWDATEVYNNMSPFTWANRIAANKTAPLLLIHGQDDANSGTAPLQSERLFGAIKGLGGVARLCMLPKEGHHYKTIEGVMHATWEMDQWLERYVLNAEPLLPEEESPMTEAPRATVEQPKL